MKAVALDSFFWFFLILLTVIGIVVMVTVLFPNIVVINQEITCRNKIHAYCSVIVCGNTPNFDLKGCEKYVGSEKPSKEDCLRIGFKCG